MDGEAGLIAGKQFDEIKRLTGDALGKKGK